VRLLFLKIWWWQHRVGSIPTLGTNYCRGRSIVCLPDQALAMFRNFLRKMPCGNFSEAPDYLLVFAGTNLAHGDDTALR
jgi:hypothetical protein